ncbi:hypothetical protein DSM106972_080510 [Dulcicalothrix desertica PCC 7102]|uniref:DUF928 domain-containing protein n=1 Tax=Dulcicalothrix desertica PCC 7102 TaxID=232991 RepID=A0A433UXS9_9CYAN|nr:DUF928 domain-containing protein [Dulcicalothrix desertica]RUS98665.1 hypothetical protein DSM106972_080510 [Dulcicalothrix desertica PCC 7102]TWH43169.1 uncharacterized protein DUF928 [Dulcicalothrix desertica PCC 7102]
MTTLKFYTQTVKILLLTAISTSCGNFPNAESKEPLNTKNPNLILASIKYEPPPPPTTSGEPTGTGGQGGAGRGCEPTALVPTMLGKNSNYLWGQTVSSRPQFWFALPRKLTKKDAVEFVLKENQGKEIYKTTLKSEVPQGIVSFSVPNTIPPLQTNKIYRWSLSVYCDVETVEDKPGSVEGSIQRVSISTKLKNQLAGAKTPIEQAGIYAQNGIWFDALTSIAVNMRATKSQDASLAWNELLTQVKLEKIAKLPVTNCCTK